ncbi:hypothetical protein VFPPC_17476 [Pochonia chlamydosporia 170]|uniref:Uncharacterized protein n=1 Tax=Pochonia chlamydosporia 170 TaxID=1380566 RepID=A0A219ARH6_METCM|nr:hypothetical protein VFPPC_17476 [Pochonia chlamydosporia 170]OWT43361.1 hypothetical protein VFPPC_17476 [Pochonia chlamydosporia 170]
MVDYSLNSTLLAGRYPNITEPRLKGGLGTETNRFILEVGASCMHAHHFHHYGKANGTGIWLKGVALNGKLKLGWQFLYFRLAVVCQRPVSWSSLVVRTTSGEAERMSSYWYTRCKHLVCTFNHWRITWSPR